MPLSKDITAAILDAISEGVFTVDRYFKIKYFNRAAEETTGFHRSEVLGKFCKQIFQSNLCVDHCPIATVLETGQTVSGMYCKVRHRSGADIQLKMNAGVLLDDEGEPAGGVISFQNIAEIERLKKDLEKTTQFHGIVGVSKPMQEIFQLIEEIADSDAAVLIQGESGTGKEMIANAIQATSLRKDHPFVKINCSVFSPQLLASELFGHVKGAFTGAIRDRAGRFEIADGGTIFLDEVAEMPLEMQIQLLRVLQEGVFERVGESISRRVNVRVIAATNKDLKQSLQNGQFRQDLFYRLNVIPIHVPPLRERREDIPHLIRHFIKKYSHVYHKEIHDVDDEALDLLMRYPWPGNVRELENAIEYAFARTRDQEFICACKLPAHLREDMVCEQPAVNSPVIQGDEMKRILDLLNKHQWNKTRVARELGIGRTTLWRKLRQYKLLNGSR